MNKIKPDLDIILDILKETQVSHPFSGFIEAYYTSTQERGSLSKKQLEGLYNKAATVSTIPPGKLATLEAIILKKPTRYKSAKPVTLPVLEKDNSLANLMNDILSVYPQHKRVLFYQIKV